jgi:hypothetical protein
MARELPPGGMSPLSRVLSLNTIRCVTVSLLRHTTLRSTPADPGLGVKDCVPRSPTIEMMGAPLLGGGEGPPGLPPYPLPPPQPEQMSRDATAAKPSRTRMSSSFDR